MNYTALYKPYTLAFIIFLVGIFASCKDNGPVVENVTVHDVQIINFKISVKNKPEISSAFFSIDNARGTIYNAIPLPFGSKIDSVLPIIQMIKANNVQLAVGDGAFKDWKATDSISLKESNGVMRIRLTSRDGEATKEYKVKVEAYSFDPDTYVWEPIEGCNLPAQQNHTPQWIFEIGKTDAPTQLLIRQGESTQAHLCLGTPANSFRDWKKIKMTGLEGDIDMICRTRGEGEIDNLIFASTTIGGDKRLYRGTISTEGVSWAQVSLPEQCQRFSLLGVVFDPDTKSLEKNITVYLTAIKPNMAQESTPTSFATFATGTNHLAVSDFRYHEDLPTDFPDVFYTSITSIEHNKSVVRIIGGRKTSATLKGRHTNWNNKGAQLWYTTNGHDWLQPTPSIVGDVPISNDSFGTLSMSNKQYIYFGHVIQNDGKRSIAVFVSPDRGASWRLGNPSLMLPPASMFGEHVDFAFTDHRGNIYLGSSVSSKIPGGSILWRGHLKLQD